MCVTFAIHRNAAFKEEMTMHALNTDMKITLWLVCLCSVVLAPLAARADVVTDWNMTAIRAAQAAGQPKPMFARNLAMAAMRHPQRRRKDEAAEFRWHLLRLAAAITEFHQNLPPAKNQTVNSNVTAMDKKDHKSA